MSTLPTDHPDDDGRVRELLADARHTEPIPDDVAARLDAALADLRHEPQGGPSPAVPDLAAARRRRNVRNLLAAAAAVVVVGVGIGQLDLSGTADSDSAADGGSSMSGAGDSAGDTAGGGADDSTDRQLTDGLRATGPVVGLDADHFGRQVRRLSGTTAAYDADRNLSSYASTPESLSDSSSGAEKDQPQPNAARLSCDPTDWGPGRRVKARYDGKPGVLIYRPRQGDTQVVELFLCGHDDPTRSITLARH